MDIEGVARQLEKSGRAKKLRSVAESEDGRKIAAMFDPAQLEKAAKSGDAAALGGILDKLLGTEEGKRLAQAVSEAMK